MRVYVLLLLVAVVLVALLHTSSAKRPQHGAEGAEGGQHGSKKHHHKERRHDAKHHEGKGRKGKHGKKQQQQHENGWTSERSEQARQQEQQQQNENQQAGQEGKQDAEVKFTKGKQHKGKQGNKDAMAENKGYKQQKQKEKLNKDQAAAQEKQQSKYAKKADKGKQTKEPKVPKEEAQQQQRDKDAAEQQPEPAQYHKQDQAQRPVEQSQPAAKDLCAESRTHQAAPSSTKCQTGSLDTTPVPLHGASSSTLSNPLATCNHISLLGDPKETGQLDVEGVKRLWKSLHMDITQMSAKWLISLADDSKNGKLNFGEFLYLWMMAVENSEFQSTPEGQAMLKTMQNNEIYPAGSDRDYGGCYTLNPWARTRFLDQGDEGRPLPAELPHTRVQEARKVCEHAAKQRAAFIAQAKSLYEGSTQMQHKFHAERRAEFINWARTTFEDEKAAQKNAPGGNEPDGHDGQITYHDSSVCPVMNKSSPAISEFSLDQCSFLADWFHRWDMNKDGLLDGCEISNMFHCLRIPIDPAALRAVVQYFDEDMDGKLSFREFLLMWRAAIYDPDFRRTAEGCKMVKHMRIHNLLPNQTKAAW